MKGAYCMHSTCPFELGSVTNQLFHVQPAQTYQLRARKAIRSPPRIETPWNARPETVLQDSAVISYSADKVIGNGSFGVVFKATKVDTGEVVAIKKVLQDKRFKVSIPVQ